MEVILLEKIRHLGALGDRVKVKPGFARNFLIPQGRAVSANEPNLVKFEKRRAELEAIAGARHQEALAKQAAIQALPVITIVAKAGEEGKLFGSIGTRDIVEAITPFNVVLEKRNIRLPNSLRMLGDYTIVIELDSDVTAEIKVSVITAG